MTRFWQRDPSPEYNVAKQKLEGLALSSDKGLFTHAEPVSTQLDDITKLCDAIQVKGNGLFAKVTLLECFDFCGPDCTLDARLTAMLAVLSEVVVKDRALPTTPRAHRSGSVPEAPNLFTGYWIAEQALDEYSSTGHFLFGGGGALGAVFASSFFCCYLLVEPTILFLALAITFTAVFKVSLALSCWGLLFASKVRQLTQMTANLIVTPMFLPV